MKLAILQGFLSEASGGLAASVPSMVRALSEHTRIEPHVLGVTDGKAAETMAKWGLSVHEHKAFGPDGFHWAPSMASTLDAISPDVIDTQGVWMNLSRVALSLRKRKKTALIVTPRGMLDPWALRQSAYRKRLVAMLFENRHLTVARAVRALNVDEAIAIQNFNRLATVAIVPNGIEPPDATSLKCITDRQPIIQFIGRLHRKKGIEALLQAWAIVKRDTASADWQLRMNGWGEPAYRASLERLASDLELDNSFILAGPIFNADKAAALGSASGFILPSYSEGLPMAVLEAWSWGTPALITRECNLPEGFSTGAALEISTEPQELARSILKFFELSPLERAAMSTAGRRLIDTHFHSREVAYRLEKLYTWAVGGSDKPEGLFFR